MSKKDLQKERIDRVGRKLLEATLLADDELEKIVAAPHLFDSVKKRIKAEPPRRAKARFAFWNLQTASAAFAVLLVILAAAAVIFVKTPNAPQTVEAVMPPKIETPPAPVEISKPAPEIVRTKEPVVKTPDVSQKVDFKQETPKQATRAEKTQPEKTESQALTHKPKVVFYPLGAAGNWEAEGEDSQIVRAELSRSELFALGVNIPVENESAKIKTDLLVGADGVARAFRFVE